MTTRGGTCRRAGVRSALLLKSGSVSTFTTLQGTGKNDWKSSISHPVHSDFEIYLKEKGRRITKRDGKAFRDLTVSVKKLGSHVRGQGLVTVWGKFWGKTRCSGSCFTVSQTGKPPHCIDSFGFWMEPILLIF